jgi:hypothetical protein
MLFALTLSIELKVPFQIVRWALSDLSILKLRLKCEFSASRSNLLDKEARFLLSQ